MQKILIVDDDPDILDILRLTLEQEGFVVSEASDGEEALQKVSKEALDLVIVDYRMPKRDGIDVCSQIKKDILLRHMPVIMLTGLSELDYKLTGIDAGADDYIVKPFEPRELVARVKMILRRSTSDLDANPLTRLPGNVAILNEIESYIKMGRKFAVCYIDLNKFKSFNDRYGFERGDEAIRSTGRILIDAVAKEGNQNDFIGHIGGDDFILITTPDKVDTLCSRVIKEFDSTIPNLYDKGDRDKGFIVSKDRQGNTVELPLMSISIGVVTNEYNPITHFGQVGQIGAELKAYAKTLGSSTYVKNRRE